MYSSNSARQRNFLPKTTFTYEPAASDCPKPNNFVASNVTAHTADLSWESDGFEFVLQYKKASQSSWNEESLYPEDLDFPYTLTNLTAETEYQARVAAIHETCPQDPETGDHVQSDWREISFTTGIACFAPTNLAVTPESIAAREATVTWEGTSNSYVVMIGEENLAVSADFETGDLGQAGFTSSSDYPWTVVANTHSGAYCAKSGNGGHDSSTSYLYLEVNLTADMTLTFSAKVSSESGWDKAYFSIDGDVKINAISGDGNWIDYSYPLTAGTHTLSWRYTKDSGGAGNDDCFYVDDIVVSAGVDSWTDYNANALTYGFTNLTPNRHYQVKVKGNCGDEGYSQETAPVRFTTLESCPTPTGLAASNITAHEATITWTSAANAWQICVNDDEEHLIDVTETTYNFTGLAPETTYTVKVRTNCGDEYSDWTNNMSFTTLEACLAPTGFAVAENGLTGHTATLNWQGTSNEYQVSYRTAAYMDGIEEGFNSDPEGWSYKTGALNADGTATLIGNSSWNRGTSNGVFDTHIYMNMYSNSSKDYWLITPSMEIRNGDALSFDMAYTAYGGTQAAPTPNSPTHRFAVLISTDDMQHWTILREWNNSGSEYVLDQVSTSGENSGNIDLSAYVGQTAYIAFFGHSEVTNYDNNFHFDNVAIGTPVPAGEMQYASNITEETVTLQGLLAETEYEAWLQGDCGSEGPSTEVGPISFTTLDVIVWNNPDDWTVPETYADVTIPANTLVIIPSGYTAYADEITIEEGGQITIEDGGQLVTNTAVTATVQKEIKAHGETTADGGWYFIASPISTDVDPSVAGLITDDLGSDVTSATATYDLYYFYENPGNELEWKNYRNTTFNLDNMGGYLYANKAKVTLNFMGSINPATSSMSKTLDFTEGAELAGWNLVGNPFTFNAAVDQSYYILDNIGSTILAEAQTSGTIPPCTGILVQADGVNQQVTFRLPTEGMPSNGNLNIAVAQANVRNNTVIDKAVLSFNEGSQLGKFYFGQSKANIYFPQFNEELAIVQSEGMGEMPLSFRANESGTYTLSFNAEEVSFSYLHLIDNMTGMDVDLLQAPRYTFEARTTDYSSRFKLVFATGSNNDSDNFAFFSNGTWVISNDGEATLQVIDVTGRVLSSETVNGSVSKAINASAGVYMLRLINGNDVKTQKIVVR